LGSPKLPLFSMEKIRAQSHHELLRKKALSRAGHHPLSGGHKLLDFLPLEVTQLRGELDVRQVLLTVRRRGTHVHEEDATQSCRRARNSRAVRAATRGCDEQFSETDTMPLADEH
jgi:hypothetical protein